MHKKSFFWLALLWTILVIVLSLITIRNTPKVISDIPSTDKVVHFLFYFVFVFLWGKYFLYKHQLQSRTFLLLFATAVFLGGFMEVCQGLFTRNRSADWYDFLANTVGAFSGTVVIYLYSKIKNYGN